MVCKLRRLDTMQDVSEDDKTKKRKCREEARSAAVACCLALCGGHHRCIVSMRMKGVSAQDEQNMYVCM